MGIRDRQQTGFSDVCFLERKLSSSSPLKTSSRIDGSLLPAESLVEQSTQERYAQGRQPRLHADASWIRKIDVQIPTVSTETASFGVLLQTAWTNFWDSIIPENIVLLFTGMEFWNVQARWFFCARGLRTSVMKIPVRRPLFDWIPQLREKWVAAPTSEIQNTIDYRRWTFPLHPSSWTSLLLFYRRTGKGSAAISD